MELPDYRMGHGRFWQRLLYRRRKAMQPEVREEVRDLDAVDLALASDMPAPESEQTCPYCGAEKGDAAPVPEWACGSEIGTEGNRSPECFERSRFLLENADDKDETKSALLDKVSETPQENVIKARGEESMKSAGRWTLARPLWQIVLALTAAVLVIFGRSRKK